jgi:protein-disulfide isomerase
VKCNPYVTSTLHPNSCWAARAAEAAGILAGDDGFWKMHRWLFSRGGSFTDAELKSGLAELDFSPESFIPVMTGAETLKRVRADCGEGEALGIFYSPMIFVNGVEFKGWQIAGALRRTIEEVAARNPPPLTAAADRPVLAAQRFIDDWQEQPVRTTLARPRAWSTGAASGSGGSRAVDVVLFGDYQEPYTAEMDVAIRESMRGEGNVRYTFRHFPIDPTCNPTLPPNVRKEAIHPKAGQAAKAAEAAGSIGGAAGFWKMHDWLMRNLETFSDESLRAAAGKMGIDADALFAAMQRPEITAPIFEDERAAQQLGLNAVPMVFVNGRWVPRAMRGDENIVLRIIEEAGKP